MGKLALILYISVALFLLFLIQLGPKKPNQSHSIHHRRVGPVHLKLRRTFNFSGAPHDPVAFDPLIAEIERHREDREFERHYLEHSHRELLPDSAPGEESQPEWEDFMDAEDYLNDEDRFNITNRLVALFPRVDLDPVDGFLSSEELTGWYLQQAMKEVMHRTERDMELHDKNRDGFVSFSEYEAPSWARTHSDDTSVVKGWWSKDHFNSSDEDGDGLLNRTEYHNFQHPSDSNNPRLLWWLCQEEIRERDTNKDGKLDFQEFFNGIFDLIRNYDEVDGNSSHRSDISAEAPAKKLFAELDQDNDRYLSEEELLPIISKLHPGEHYYAKQQADYIMMQADTDKDGRLSLKEMIDNPYVFYSAIFTDEDDYEYHDEFR